jgi:hypothetical protein
MKFTDSIREKFRDEVQKAKRRTYFDTQRKAYFRYLPKSKGRRYLKGVHRTVARAFGSLGSMIAKGGGGDGNKTRSKTPTSRGSRIGRELCKWAESGKLPKQAHGWSHLVVSALNQWNVHLIDGEVPVSRGNIATGIDLLGVRYNEKDLTWRLICIELKSGYRGKAWNKALGGLAKGTVNVKRSIKNYALTQLQLTHLCAEKSLPGYCFDKPLLVQVNDDGVSKSSPTTSIVALGRQLLR